MTDTYSTILEVAERLFAQQGYTATSMRQIAEEVGIGKATIYHHFPDKEAIALALLKTRLGSMDEGLEIIRAESDPSRRVETALSISTQFLIESAEILQTIWREVSGAREVTYGYFASFFRGFVELMADAFQRGVETGIFRPMDPAETARVLMTMVQGNFVQTLMLGAHPDSIEKANAALLDVFYHGIKVGRALPDTPDDSIKVSKQGNHS